MAATARTDRPSRARPSGSTDAVHAIRSAARPRRAAGAPLAVRPDPDPAQLPRRPRALARSRDVHLFLLHPSPALWEQISDLTHNAPPTSQRRDRIRPPTAARNRLLASWGQDARELQLVLGPARPRTSTITTRVRSAADTLLGRIQADVRADQRPPGHRFPAGPTPGRCSSDTTAASRSTPATAAHARSRSCATRSCTCCRTTRRSSRAT